MVHPLTLYVRVVRRIDLAAHNRAVRLVVKLFRGIGGFVLPGVPGVDCHGQSEDNGQGGESVVERMHLNTPYGVLFLSVLIEFGPAEHFDLGSFRGQRGLLSRYRQLEIQQLPLRIQHV